MHIYMFQLSKVIRQSKSRCCSHFHQLLPSSRVTQHHVYEYFQLKGDLLGLGPTRVESWVVLTVQSYLTLERLSLSIGGTTEVELSSGP